MESKNPCHTQQQPVYPKSLNLTFYDLSSDFYEPEQTIPYGRNHRNGLITEHTQNPFNYPKSDDKDSLHPGPTQHKNLLWFTGFKSY